ncbi:hypothetical protein LUZ60_006385 [Juncus effusus]|nr:hypothetical protein LUZ60_006385 [Juncus effusus]
MASMVSHEQGPNILNRVDRLDVMLGYLEDLRLGRPSGERTPKTPRTPRSPAASTNSSGRLIDVFGDSSVTSSPKSLSRRPCRSVEEVMMEMKVKGNLLDRIELLETRILKLEDEVEVEKKEGRTSPKKSSPRKGLKKLVKACVHGGELKTKE